MKSNTIIEQWTYYGNHYGYPKCCIHSFCYQVTTRSQRRAGNGTGFIPCKQHAKLYPLIQRTQLRRLTTISA